MKKLDIEFIKECVDKGLTDNEISILMNCNRVSVTRARKNNNIKKRDIGNVMDKTYVCIGCYKTIYIKRNDSAKMFCDNCLKKMT